MANGYGSWLNIGWPFSTISHSHQPSAMSDRDLHPADAEAVAVRNERLVHTPAVDEGPVRALQIDYFQLVGAGGDPAVQSRDKRRVDDEIGARGAADGFDRA